MTEITSLEVVIAPWPLTPWYLQSASPSTGALGSTA